MNEGALFQPMTRALAMLPRVPSLVTWGAVFAVAVWVRDVQTRPYYGDDTSALVTRNLMTTFVPALIAGLLIFLLGRTMVAEQRRPDPPLYARFLGLFIARGLIGWFITGVGTLLIFTSARSPFMMTYGSVLVGSLSSIATLPFLTRALSAAAGVKEPKLGGVIAFSLEQGRYVYLWFVLVSLLFPVLMVFTFANVLAPANANHLPGNLLQSAITSLGSVLQYLLAVLAAQSTRPNEQELAQTFA